MVIRIRTKIILSFATVLILLFVLSFISFYSRGQLIRAIDNLESEMDEMVFFAGLRLAVDMSVMPPNDYLITGELAEKEKFARLAEQVDSGFSRLRDSETHKAHFALLANAEEVFTRIKRKSAEIFALSDPVGSMAGRRLMREIDELSHEIVSNRLSIYFDVEKDELRTEVAASEAAFAKMNRLLLIGVSASAVISVLLILYLIRSIIRPIRIFKEGAFLIGRGNLDYRIGLRDGFEINLLVDEFNRMAGMLQESYERLEDKVEERTQKLNDANEMLRELSVTDGLTGAYNHRHFYERLKAEIERARRNKRPLSLLMVDIDDFKNYNDTHGHIEGDAVLKGVAECMMKSVRGQDFVARYGGEEFAIILPETDLDGAVSMAERIRLYILSRNFPSEETQPGGVISVSIGAATLSPASPPEPEFLIKEADDALYLAKSRGRNRVERADRRARQ